MLADIFTLLSWFCSWVLGDLFVAIKIFTRKRNGRTRWAVNHLWLRKKFILLLNIKYIGSAWDIILKNKFITMVTYRLVILAGEDIIKWSFLYASRNKFNGVVGPVCVGGSFLICCFIMQFINWLFFTFNVSSACLSGCYHL